MLLELADVDEVLGAGLAGVVALARVYSAATRARLERLGRHGGGATPGLLLLLGTTSPRASIFCHELGEQLLLLLMLVRLVLSG